MDTSLNMIASNRPDAARRRQFLKILTGTGAVLGATLGSGLSTQSHAATTNFGPDRELHLINVHTGEELSTLYWSRGRYVESAMTNINYLMRDHRADEVKPIDPIVLDYLYYVRNGLHLEGREGLIQILSGYRSPATNAKLASKSSGVASKSLHMEGRAIDFSIAGFKASELRDVAMKLQRGGVGYYPKSGFIHIDSGAFRHWG